MSEYIYGTDENHGHWLTGEEIVRCRDCVHCYDDDSVWMCAKLGFGIDYITSDEKPNGFCAWGERRPTWRDLENSDQYAAAAHAFDTTNHNVCSERGE